MNGKDPAEQFNKELDGLFSGARRGAPDCDPAALETAKKLFRADFSVDSRIRESLRAELLARERKTSWRGAIAWLLDHNAYIQIAMTAACLMLVLLPVMRIIRRRPVLTGAAPAAQAVRYGSSSPFQGSSVTVSGGIKTTRLMEPAQTAATNNAAAGPVRQPESELGAGIFRGIPMARLPGVNSPDSTVATVKGSSPIVLNEGRKVGLANGSGVVWETENGVFMLERRATSVEEIFQRKTL